MELRPVIKQLGRRIGGGIGLTFKVDDFVNTVIRARLSKGDRIHTVQ
jgi:hypothetical protein